MDSGWRQGGCAQLARALLECKFELQSGVPALTPRRRSGILFDLGIMSVSFCAVLVLNFVSDSVSNFVSSLVSNSVLNFVPNFVPIETGARHRRF
jgi:hypothetical protein